MKRMGVNKKKKLIKLRQKLRKEINDLEWIFTQKKSFPEIWINRKLVGVSFKDTIKLTVLKKKLANTYKKPVGDRNG